MSDEIEFPYTRKIGEIEVTVKSRGMIASPIDQRSSCWGYTLSAMVDGETYYGDAHGSIHDCESGAYAEAAAETMALMCADELLSAANDPDEFWALATGYGEAMPTDREKVKGIMDLLDFAERHAETIQTAEPMLFDAREQGII